MKNTYLRIACIGLVLLIMLAVFAGCKKEKSNDPVSDDHAQSTEAEDSSIDNLPDDLDYGGKAVKFYTWSEVKDADWQEEYSAELIDGAVYESREYVAERLNFVYDLYFADGNWDNRNSFVAGLENAMSSGTAYDIVTQYTPTAALATMKGLYQNLNQVDYLDFDQPWWPGNITESCSIGNSVYFCTGDLTQMGIKMLGSMFINLDKWESLSIEENIYDLVLNYEWTMEKMMTLTLGLVGTAENVANQEYALQMEGRIVYDNLFFAAGLTWVDHDSDNLLQLNEMLSDQKTIDWYETCHNLLWENPDVGSEGNMKPGTDNTVNLQNCFMAGKALMFMSLNLNNVQDYLVDADFDYVVVPYPMYDAEQKEYRSVCGYSVTMYSIPTNAADADMSGAVLEAMCSSGYELIIPAVYEQSFRLRYLQDPRNAELLDIIHDSVVWDTGRIFSDDAAMYNLFRNAFYDVEGMWSTIMAKNSNGDAWRVNLEKINIKLAYG